MIPQLPMDVYAERRARLVAQLAGGVCIVPGAHLARRVNDVDHVFRQQSDFLYLTGFSHPDAVLVLSELGFTLFVQPRDRDAETWTGRRPGVDGAIALYGADQAYPVSELAQRLPQLLDGAPRLFHRFGLDADVDRVVLDVLDGLRRRIRTGARPPQETQDPIARIAELRLRKDEAELRLMRHAAEISHDAHHAAAIRAQPGAFEYELEAALFHVFRSRGGSGPAYPSIVAAGENATILHYTENESVLKQGELVLIDAGVEYAGYAADVTRTYPVGGRFEGAAADVYAAVLRAQRATLQEIRAGTTLRALHDVAVRSLCESLVDLGALEGSVDHVVEHELFRRYYMHGTGHFLGLDVHDAGDSYLDGKPRPLEPGMVFTVEPGLYFRPDEPGCPRALRGIGVRIEDDVVITDSGYEVLTESVPKERGAIEAWMQSGDERRSPHGT